MINLIPTEEKVRLARAYQKRFIIVFLALTAAALFIGSVLIVPPYWQAMEKTATMQKSVDITKSLGTGADDKNLEVTMKEVQKKLDLFAARKTRLSPSGLIGAILKDKPKGVKLDGFTYGFADKGGQTVEIRGVAETRETLLSFIRALESDASFSKVAVPVASFVKETDIVFSIMASAKTPSS